VEATSHHGFQQQSPWVSRVRRDGKVSRTCIVVYAPDHPAHQVPIDQITSLLDAILPSPYFSESCNPNLTTSTHLQHSTTAIRLETARYSVHEEDFESIMREELEAAVERGREEEYVSDLLYCQPDPVLAKG
jgi:hypothetical protein